MNSYVSPLSYGISFAYYIDMQWINGYQHLVNLSGTSLSGRGNSMANRQSTTAFADILAARINAASASGGEEILSPQTVKLLAMILTRHLGSELSASMAWAERHNAPHATPTPTPKPATQPAVSMKAPDASLHTPAQNDTTPAHAGFSDLIKQAAHRYHLDPSLISSVIETESSFNPKAVSHAGAQGLMQLMPGTAHELNVTDPFDPAQNIDGGSRYLAQLLKRYHGDTKLALAAYNWGMGNLEQQPEKMPAETKNYVANVMKRWERKRTALA